MLGVLVGGGVKSDSFPETVSTKDGGGEGGDETVLGVAVGNVGSEGDCG